MPFRASERADLVAITIAFELMPGRNPFELCHTAGVAHYARSTAVPTGSPVVPLGGAEAGATEPRAETTKPSDRSSRPKDIPKPVRICLAGCDRLGTNHSQPQGLVVQVICAFEVYGAEG